MASKSAWANRIVGQADVAPAELLAHPENWRKHPLAQKQALTGVLNEVGWVQRVIVNQSTGRIIDGHLRVEMAVSRKMATVPVVYVELTEDEERKILAAFDPIAAMATTNEEMLKQLLDSIQTQDAALAALLEQMASEIGELPIPRDDAEQVDDAESLREKWGAESGDLWIIPSATGSGAHRLLCGDSGDVEAVARLMNGARGALMATDPPYGIDYAHAVNANPRRKAWDAIENDELSGEDLRHFIRNVWAGWLPHLSSNAGYYTWSPSMMEGYQIALGLQDAGLHIQSQIIWVKNTFALGQADYQWRHEICWYGYVKGVKHRWFGERDKSTVWEVDRLHTGDYEHPMQKPVELYARPIQYHTRKGEVVVDPFAGSGTQFIAAEQLGRLCYGMELAPKYVAVALERMARLGLIPRKDGMDGG